MPRRSAGALRGCCRVEIAIPDTAAPSIILAAIIGSIDAVEARAISAETAPLRVGKSLFIINYIAAAFGGPALRTGK